MAELTLEALRKLVLGLKQRDRPRVIGTVRKGTCGIARAVETLLAASDNAAQGTDGFDIVIKTSDCAGLCSREPMITRDIEGAAPVKHLDLNSATVAEIYSEHVTGGNPIVECVLGAGGETIY